MVKFNIFKSKLVLSQLKAVRTVDGKNLRKNKKIQENKHSIKFQVFLPNKCLSFKRIFRISISRTPIKIKSEIQKGVDRTPGPSARSDPRQWDL